MEDHLAESRQRVESEVVCDGVTFKSDGTVVLKFKAALSELPNILGILRVSFKGAAMRSMLHATIREDGSGLVIDVPDVLFDNLVIRPGGDSVLRVITECSMLPFSAQDMKKMVEKTVRLRVE